MKNSEQKNIIESKDIQIEKLKEAISMAINMAHNIRKEVPGNETLPYLTYLLETAVNY